MIINCDIYYYIYKLLLENGFKKWNRLYITKSIKQIIKLFKMINIYEITL